MDAILKAARNALDSSPLVQPALLLVVGIVLASLFVAQQRAGKTLFGIAWYRGDNPFMYWWNQIVLAGIAVVFTVSAVGTFVSILQGR